MKTTKAVFGVLAVTAVLATQGQAQSFLTNGLVAYYPLDGNASDMSGNGNNGIPRGVGFSTDRFGNPSSSGAFSGLPGTNSAIDCPSLNNLPYFPITYSCWFLMHSNLVMGVDYAASPTAGAQMTLVGREQSDVPAHEGALILVSRELAGWTNEMQYFYYGEQPHLGRFSPSTNTWYQAVVTIDATGLLSLYINGALRGTYSESPAALSGLRPLPFRIGGSTWYYSTPNPGAPRYSWRGSIDDVRIYSRALSSNDVLQLYATELKPSGSLGKAVKPSFSSLAIGANYQLQVSADMKSWTNYGSPFTATNSSMVYPQYWDVDNWGKLFFQLQVAP